MSEHPPVAAEMTNEQHPYHLVNPSPLPLMGAFAAGTMAVGGVVGMHGNGYHLAILGFVAVLATMIIWWRDVLHESGVEKAHSPITNLGFRYGMSLFIASEVMFFFAFFWAYFNAALVPTAASGGVWPPVGVETVDPFDLPSLMTMVLLLSGITVSFAHEAMVKGDQQMATRMLGATVGLGIFFTAIQVYEYTHVSFGFTDGIYSSTFYMATGFHGLHVLIGTIFLIVCWKMSADGKFTKEDHFTFEAAAWYWHFVDVVWLFLFAGIYVWGA